MRSEPAVLGEPAAATGWRHPAVRGLGWTALTLLLLGQVWALYVAEGAGSPLFPHADKVGHLGMFALPALLAVLLRAPAVLVVLLLHAVVAEPLQDRLTTSRVTDAWDAVANLTGVAAGALVGRLLRRWR